MAASATVRTGAPGSIGRLTDLILPVGIIASVLVIMVPMPAALLDVMLAANITLAVIMLLTTIYVRTPLEFSIFPSLLLATTLARLVLNVATTRLVLTHAGADGLLAAGHVVKAFGEFVAGNELVVGDRDLRHRDRDSVPRDYQRRHAHQRSRRPIRFGRHAGPADGDRRRSERRRDRRDTKLNGAARRSRGKPIFSERWMVPASSSAATPSPASSLR